MSVSDFVAIINRLLPEPEASLLAGMLFGVRRTMPPDFHQALITTGTLHIVALSGFNISIIMRLLYEFCAGIFGRLLGSLLTVLGILGFVLFVGPSSTVIRAALMGSMTVLAAFLGRKDIPMLSLFFTGFLMVFWDFKILGNLSFQLSFLATFGIILFAGAVKNSSGTDFSSFVKRLPKEKVSGIIGQGKRVEVWRDEKARQLVANSTETSIPLSSKNLRGTNSLRFRNSSLRILFWTILKSLWLSVKTDLRVTLSAQVFTLPVILYNFQRISLISPLANVFTGWLVPPITYLGFLVVLLGWVWWPLGRVSSLGLWVLLKIFVVLVGFFSKFPLASIEF